MWRPVMKYLALWFFLAGILIIGFIQVYSNQNINRLINSNRQLLDEVEIQNALRDLETDVLTIESDIRSGIITSNQVYLQSTEQKISAIEDDMSRLNERLTDSRIEREIQVLNRIVQEKLSFNLAILNEYKTKGREASEDLINTGKGKVLRDSIILVVKQIDEIRQTNLKNIVSSIENTGERANVMGFILGVLASIACVFAFLFIVNKGRQQQRMIHALNDSEKRVKDMAAIKEQFLANMSHEIRTPMNAILGFSNLLKKSNLNSQQKQYIDYIYSSSENLLTIINDILDISKIEAGMMSFEEAPFSLNGLVSSVEIMFHEKAKEKNLDFSITIEPDIYDTLKGDSVRLTQILINLLSNAIKFTEKGFVKMNVKQLHHTDDEVRIEFLVTDSGIGISSEKIKAVFDRFQQAEAETTRRYGGTGLGLSIVKQLVDLQRGTIQLNSEIHKGSEFRVVLPFKPYLDFYAHKEDEILNLSLVKNMRLLVAEDNQMNQQLIKHLMNQWNLKCVIVNNGVEALDVLRNKKFSLILMDIQMPEMDGYSTTIAIRNELKLDTPVIAMTAHAMPGEKERCLSYGMNDYISKPIKNAELYEILASYGNNQLNEETEEDMTINLGYLKELSGGDTEFENTIIRQFIVQVPEELELLKEAIAVRNNQKIKSIAHGMKSSVSYLGLLDLVYQNLHRMEVEAVKDETDNHFDEDYEVISNVCNQAVKEARQMLHVKL